MRMLLALVLVAAAGPGEAQTVAAADVNMRGPDGSTAILRAAHRGDATEVARLIGAGADVSLTNRYGASPLSEAATVGDARIIELLVKAGANVNAPNPEGETALMEVARTDRVDAAKYLLRRGAAVNAREHWGGQTALMWAAAQSQPAMVQSLISHHADVNARAVVRDWQRRVTAEGRPKDMNHGGLTPLLLAAREGCIECVKHLLAGHAQIDLPDPDNVSALEMALLNLHWDLAKELVAAGADVNARDFWGQSPLYVAVDMNTLPHGGRADLPSTDQATGLAIIQMLLEKGANPNTQLTVSPPLRNVTFDRYTDQILTTGATPLLRAAKAGDIPAMKLLMAHGALIDLPNKDGITPLLAAAGSGRNVPQTRGTFRTEADAIAAYTLLRDAGAEIHAVSKKGETTLHGAALRGWNDLVRVLVADGAALDPRAQSDLTPIDFAMGRYRLDFLEPKPVPHEDTAALLRESGARLEHPDLPPWPGAPTPTITAAVPN